MKEYFDLQLAGARLSISLANHRADQPIRLRNNKP